MIDEKLYDEVVEIVEKELKKITDKGDITPSELENAKNAVSLLEKLKHYMFDESDEMYGEQSSRTGRSRGYYPHWGNAEARWSYANSSMNNRGMSRDGRYGRRGSYDYGNSYSGGADEMIDRLEMMKQEAMSDADRMAIDECIRKLMK